MGYCIHIRDTDFRIAREHTRDALKAIKDLMDDPEADRGGASYNDTGLTMTELERKPDDFRVQGRKGAYTLAEIRNLPDVEVTDEKGYITYDTARVIERHFSWLNGVDPDNWDYLKDAMADWRFPIELDDDLNVVDIGFTGEKLGDEKQMFEVIAPFVEDGSYIEMQGEDGDVWRWEFTGDSVEEVHAEAEF